VSHSMARLNPYGRELLCRRIQLGWPVRTAAKAAGISHARAYVIWHRYLSEGDRAFTLRSSRPQHSPRRTAARVERRIERERRHRRWGPLRLSWLLGIARSTIYAVLRRLGLGHRRVFRVPLPAPHRYERQRPGDLVHIDSKKLGRIPAGGGKRVDAALVRNRRPGKLGWDYLHVAVDDRTRVWYVERLAGADARSCGAFCERALHYFADLGVGVRQVMTDNAFSYIHGASFQQVLARYDIEHLRIPAYTPRWNGKVEAAIGILLREWAYARPYRDNRARAIALPAFVHSYNHRRPHGELGGLTPMQRLLADVNNVRGQHN
jgi:Integrase core domain/leucine-zipper of insertion element IS481